MDSAEGWEDERAASTDQAVREDQIRTVIMGDSPLAWVARLIVGCFPLPVGKPIPAAVAHIARVLDG